LVVDEAALPSQFEVSARTADGIVMALRHRRRPLVGVQFHPESILTTEGYRLLAGFLQVAGLSAPSRLPTLERDRPRSRRALARRHSTPVTF
jgi:GMP synthase-like glutamine amidotransferase